VNPTDVRQKIASGAADLLAELRVRSLFVFGSVARAEAGPESDVDLLVDFQGPPSFDQYMALQEGLERALGCKVDLVTRGALRERLRGAIEREAIRVA
jgi:predicted nucleotidyltransferase